jgi:NADPH:quinone reductase-like Zn-dependent oxidoreductase
MSLRKRILFGVAGLLFIAVAAFAIVLSHESPCPAPAAAAAEGERMHAIVHRCYGDADVLRLEEVERPRLADDRVLVKVRAAGANPLDWHYLHGTPYLMRLSAGFGAPNDARMGVDFSGTVEAVGAKVTRFKPGDEVFGGASGAFAEYVSVREEGSIAHKPPNVSFEQAGGVGVAAVTALQGLRDKGRLQRGQKVLINGASGGVGTFAVQLAKEMGAHVTGVCSTRNIELVRSLGADAVIDYTQESVVERPERYDVILDNVGNLQLSDARRLLTANGVFVLIGGGGPDDGRWIGPMLAWLKAPLYSKWTDQEFLVLLADMNQQDLSALSELMAADKIKPIVDRTYSLAETPDAIRYLEQGRARGKVVIQVATGDPSLAAPTTSLSVPAAKVGTHLIAASPPRRRGPI